MCKKIRTEVLNRIEAWGSKSLLIISDVNLIYSERSRVGKCWLFFTIHVSFMRETENDTYSY